MALLSKFPIDAAAARSWQLLRWADMPGALLPRDPDTGAPWYDAGDLQVRVCVCGCVCARVCGCVCVRVRVCARAAGAPPSAPARAYPRS